MPHKPEDYLYAIPKPSEIPPGRVVVHNQVTRDITPRRPRVLSRKLPS